MCIYIFCQFFNVEWNNTTELRPPLDVTFKASFETNANAHNQMFKLSLLPSPIVSIYSGAKDIEKSVIKLLLLYITFAFTLYSDARDNAEQ